MKMTLFQKIMDSHLAVTDAVSHGERLSSDRYIVWEEDGRSDLLAEGAHGEIVITGTSDLFTKNEFDPWAEELEESMTMYDIAWSLDSVSYEESTGFWHYSWDWEVC